jgi:hypothetical protein
MTVTWHWELGKGEAAEDAEVHARRLDSEKTLCGRMVATAAVMRPPFFEARCEECERLRAGEEEMFPNQLRA